MRNLPCDSCSPGGPGEFGGQTRNLPILVVDVSPSDIVSLQKIHKTYHRCAMEQQNNRVQTFFTAPQHNINMNKKKVIIKIK